MKSPIGRTIDHSHKSRAEHDHAPYKNACPLSVRAAPQEQRCAVHLGSARRLLAGRSPRHAAGVSAGRLSAGLSDWLSRASRGAGTLPDHVAVPMLGVTSSLIGKARRVQASSSWIEPMTLWTCVVGA